MAAFPLPNYTQVPNYIIDEWMHKLTHAEFKFIMLIVRLTCGYHRREASISYSDFEKKCGIDRRWIKKIIKKFEDLGCIKVKHGNNSKSNIYEILMCSEKDENSKNYVGDSNPQGGGLKPPPSREPKEREIKDRKKGLTPSRSAQNLTLNKKRIIKKVCNDERFIDFKSYFTVDALSTLFAKYSETAIKRSLNHFIDCLDKKVAKVKKSPVGYLKAILDDQEKNIQEMSALDEEIPDVLD